MSKLLDIPIPKGETKPKFIHHGRRSLDSNCLTVTAVDSKDLLPNYLTPSKGSCHDKCKYGSSHDKKFGSSCIDEKRDLLTSKRSPSFAKPPVVKRPSQISLEPWKIAGSLYSTDQQSRRRFSEIIAPKRYRYIEKDYLSNSERKGDGLKCTGRGRKNAQALPEVSRTVKSSSYKCLKKQNTVAKEKSRKCIEEHVPEKILHFVEPKAESEGNEPIQGTSCTDSSSCNKGTFEKEVINETSDSDNSPRKVKFRKGKVIDIQQVENSTRRLKFSQHMSLLENQNCNADATKKSPKSQVNGPRKGIVIKLKHQIVEGKQGSHESSCNSLIQDTTNSLVRVKKGKVKALVNAYESVISLNNSKPTK